MKDLIDVLAEYNPKILYNGQVRMMCPFRENHEGKKSYASGYGEKSMFVSQDMNVYHCFSCGAKGKATKLLTNKFGLSYYDAVEYVSLIPLEKKVKEFELADWWDLIPPKQFTDRRFTKDTLEYFKVGLNRKKEIVIPLYLERELKGIKYRNKRDFWYTESFDKRLFLYNYNPDWEYTIIVEGETDVWRLHQYGLNATALLGTSLSEEQIEMFSKIPKIYLALDNDEPGIIAYNRCYKGLHKQCDVEFINYPAKDPGSCGRRKFLEAYEEPTNYAIFKLLTGAE